ncbi:hypothetical protein SmJEL517_g04279 [Synchytrium microbalum]|uniref:AMP-dependent synthetase/ligase domain-containing protein n=1 Tax=Synchytrium microbalum TaxID=1806994 RepID=A0A507C5B3_9FUNG|nr:uncharacterized protein SmJEL517_g04279 [Synchytrium microbalum]TPX32625.1 hypothetical protein SmJEL517_g04279 [Synchytrium microbalum]
MAQKPMSVKQAHDFLTKPGGIFELETVITNGVQCKSFKGAFKTLRDMWESTRKFADREYLVYEDERLTYAEAHAEVARIANVLVNQLSVKKGDRVGIIMRNYPEWLLCFWAVHSIGGVTSLINSWLTGPEEEYCLEDSACVIALVDEERATVLEPHLSSLKLKGLKSVVVCRGNPRNGMAHLPTLLASVPKIVSAPYVDIGPEDEAIIMYSSGTSGKPKGCLSVQKAIGANQINYILPAMRNLLRQGLPLPSGPAAAKSVLVSSPLFHLQGISPVVGQTINGNRLVLLFKWDPTKALQLIEKERINRCSCVPAVMWQQHPDFDKYDLSSWENATVGGAAVPGDLVRAMAQKLPRAPVATGYGQSEITGTLSSNVGYDYERKPTSVGLPSPTTEVRIVDPDTLKDVAEGQVGEIWCKCAHAMKEYLNRPDATAETIQPGNWVRTGDLGYVDDEGFVFIVDRIKDVVNRGGEKAFSTEIEGRLYEHPSVIDAAVFPMPHPTLGEEVIASVQVNPNKAAVTQQELKDWTKQTLAYFKVPVYIDIGTEPLIRNANGKILKKDIAPGVIAKAKAALGAKL